MKQKIKIRPAQEKDFPAIFPLLCLADFCPDAAEKKETIEKMFQDILKRKSVYRIFVAPNSEQQIIGLCGCEPTHSFGHGRRILALKDLVVHPDFRKTGVGKALLHFFEELAGKEGYDEVELTSGNWRTAAHEFYQAQGWECTAQKFSKTISRK